MKLEDWQEYVVWAWHDIDSDGRWAASECGLLVSRQNGKSEALVAFDLARLFLFPTADRRRRTVLHTAHELKTATESFEKVAAIIASNDRLMQMVDHVYTANGKEAILLKPRPGQLLGDRLRFVARSKGSGRGFAANDIVYDEAQELSPAARKALTYTQSTIPNRQELYAGTVPGEDNEGEVFEGVRDRGRAGAPRTTWQEWSPEGAEDAKAAALIDVSDPRVWQQGVPAMGTWIDAETVQEQVDRALDRDELLRERFAVWPNRPADVVASLSELDLGAWVDSADPAASVSGEGSVIAVALGKGGGYATVAKGRRFDAGHIAVEHHKTANGTLWLGADVKALKAELGDALVVVDSKNGAAIISALNAAGISPLQMNVNELAEAHTQFIEHVNAGMVPHRDQPEVTKSLQFATVRNAGTAGDTWVASDPAIPVSIAQAVTWALWGVLKSEATPKKKRAIVRGYA
jgi:phage terminase large subunit-like protein